MGMYDRDWYRDHHREQRRAQQLASEFDWKRAARWAFQVVVYSLAIIGALTLVNFFSGR